VQTRHAHFIFGNYCNSLVLCLRVYCIFQVNYWLCQKVTSSLLFVVLLIIMYTLSYEKINPKILSYLLITQRCQIIGI
jgi:hypothetical protein